MTRREIASLACRILALYMLVRVVEMLSGGLPAMVSNVYSSFNNSTSSLNQPEYAIFNYVLPTFLAPVIHAITAFALWRSSNRIATEIVENENGAQVTTNLSAHEILFLAFSIVGVMGVVYFAAWLAFLLGNMFSWQAMQFPQVFGLNGPTFHACVNLMLSLGLLIKARALANMIESHGAVKTAPHKAL